MIEVAGELLLNQTALINDLMGVCASDFTNSNVKNLFMHKVTFDDGVALMFHDEEVKTLSDSKSIVREVYQWWVVTPRLLSYLEKYNAILLKNMYGTWWGMTKQDKCFEKSSTIRKINSELRKETKQC